MTMKNSHPDFENNKPKIHSVLFTYSLMVNFSLGIYSSAFEREFGIFRIQNPLQFYCWIRFPSSYYIAAWFYIKYRKWWQNWGFGIANECFFVVSSNEMHRKCGGCAFRILCQHQQMQIKWNVCNFQLIKFMFKFFGNYFYKNYLKPK